MRNQRIVSAAIELIERGCVPDWATRHAIDRLCRRRLRSLDANNHESHKHSVARMVDAMRHGPIAPVPEKANEQHYEVPVEFFDAVLGVHKKYSCCYWPAGVGHLDAAEEAALEETCAHAEIEDGLRVLDLGCGWGSLSLWIAQRYPSCQVTAVSNSSTQRRYIQQMAERRSLDNLTVITRDMNDFTTRGQFDRVLSVEMFEHMRNYEMLLRRIRGWLHPQGRLFVHLFCHRRHAYEFETDGAANWMGRYFFTGGIMPSDDLIHRFPADMELLKQWRWDGTHYEKTCLAWLRKLDTHRARLMPILAGFYGQAVAHRWLRRWRLFFLAGAGLFGFRKGQEWYVSHYLLSPRSMD